MTPPIPASQHAVLPDAQSTDLWRFVGLLAQLLGVVWIVNRFQIESQAFLLLLVLTVTGFAVHYFLPLRFRLRFFLGLSLAGIALVLGVEQAAWLVLLGLALIGLAHLPVPVIVRAGLLLLCVAVLFLLRTRAEVPWSSAVWPILASMFMFRMIVYMYDLATGQGQATLSQRLSYFFLLPNVCFPLFPVVDFRTYVRTYYAGPRHETYQTGVTWMVRGIVQLLVYRLVHLWVSIDPYDVDGVLSLAHYFVWLYLLYLNISGQFHLIVGMLHLFGFSLPETHKRYYFASSFTDFWRRINIYWKDFMMKVFYYPIFLRLKGLGQTPALILATVCVFVATWALHAYQGFWIRGFVHFTWNDSLFWAILCLLVIVNSLWEVRHGRRRTLAKRSLALGDRARMVAKTAGTFVVICFLWAFWSSESLASWLSLWPAALDAPGLEQLRQLALLVGTCLAVVVAATVWQAFTERRPEPGFWGRSAGATAWLALLAVLSVPQVVGALGPAGSVMASIRVPRLNGFQLEQMERGYYEDLLTVDRFNRELADIYIRRPAEWVGSLPRVGTAPGTELAGNAEYFWRGSVFRTNQWGMHDRDYDREPPPDVLRIALLGASHVVGVGVRREDTFEALVEQRLNRESAGGTRYEILNFAFPNYVAFQHIDVLQTKVTQFQPDAVWYVGHPYDFGRFVRYVRIAILNEQQDRLERYPWIRDIAAKADVDEHTSVYLAERRLTGYRDEILTELYRTIVDLCRKRGIQPVYVHMPLTPEARNGVDDARYLELAARAGFVTMDLLGAYSSHGREELWLADWDSHPNEFGHQLVADRLYEEVRRQPAALRRAADVVGAAAPAGASWR